jgi:site-specific DNA recombinase
MGLSAQRSELKGFAASKQLKIVAEFSDMEISGSLDEASRPGLRDLLAALRDPARKWSNVLVLDPSRISRDPMLGLYIARECEKHDVTIAYSKLPLDASAFSETMLSVVRAFDRLHARLSGEKGLAGSLQNIKAGFRSGGAAPFGYQLKHTETGGVRGSVAVRKSTLVVDPGPARKIKAFLQARAAGVSRVEAAKVAKLTDKAVASLIAIEKNALTYAGYQVWNQRQKIKPTREDPRKTMQWRPREEWIISPAPVHEALITRSEAERILAMHGEFRPKPLRVRKPDAFLLSGLLFTPDGKQWTGDSHDNAYRAGVKGKRINAPWIEGEVIVKLADDFASADFLARTVAEARRMAVGIEADPQVLDKDIRKLEKQLGNLLDLAAESGDKSVLGRIRETEAKVATMREDKAAWAERAVLKKQLSAISVKDIRDTLAAVGLEVRGEKRVLDMLDIPPEHRLEPGQLRQVLTTLVQRIELDPATRAFTIRYRLPTGVKVASPRGFEPRLPP